MIGFLRKFCLVAALLAGGSAWGAEAPLTPVSFADLGASTNNLAQYLAIDKGIYRKYGLDLRMVDFLQGGPEAVTAVVSGQIDMGSAGTPVLSAISRGLPIRVVGSPPIKGEPFILVGRPEIAQVADIKGKLVGFSSVGGGSLQAFHVIAKAHGVRDEDVQAIAFGTGPNGYVALKSGKLAAAVLAEPYATKAEVDGVGRVLAEADKYFDRYQHSYVFANRRFINTHPEAIRAYFRATREALRYAKDHQDELVAYGVAKLGLDERTLRAVFAKLIPKWDDGFAVDDEGLLNAVSIVRDLGDIPKTYQPDLAQIVDSSFLE